MPRFLIATTLAPPESLARIDTDSTEDEQPRCRRKDRRYMSAHEAAEGSACLHRPSTPAGPPKRVRGSTVSAAACAMEEMCQRRLGHIAGHRQRRCHGLASVAPVIMGGGDALPEHRTAARLTAKPCLLAAWSAPAEPGRLTTGRQRVLASEGPN